MESEKGGRNAQGGEQREQKLKSKRCSPTDDGRRGGEGGKVCWKLAEQDWICPDREPGPGPDLRALFESQKMPRPSLPFRYKRRHRPLAFPPRTRSPSRPRLLPFFSFQTSKHTHMHTSVILHCCSTIHSIRENPGVLAEQVNNNTNQLCLRLNCTAVGRLQLLELNPQI